MKFLKKLFKGLVKLVKKLVAFIKKHWKVLLIVAVIAFAPQLAALVMQMGGPAWLSGGLSFIGTNVTAPMKAAGSYLLGGTKNLAGEAAAAFGDAKLGTKAAIVTGAAALIAPEQTASLIGKTAEAAGKFASTAGAGIVKGLTGGNGLLWIAGGATVLLLLTRRRSAN